MSEPIVLLRGLGIPESPRWHDGRLWFCNWIDRQVVAVSLDGEAEILPVRAGRSMGYSIDWLPDGRLLVTGDRLRRQEPDGSMVVLDDHPCNEIVVDGRGRVHLLAVGPSGSLIERHTAGAGSDRWSRVDRMGLPGSWSSHAAPAAGVDTLGHVWVVAVTRHGTLEARHTDRSGRHWSGFHPVDHRSWSVTSSPALSLAADGRAWLASVDQRGHLVVRHTRLRPGSPAWQRPRSMPGVWSPYSSPSLTIDSSGRTWLAAARVDGRVAVLSTSPTDPDRWRPSGGLPQVPASQTASAALTATVDGVLVAVTDGHGRTVWRRPLGQSGLPVPHGPRGGGFSVSRFL